LTIVLIVINVVRFVLSNFLSSGVDVKKYSKAGDWAVVTGATDGIGKGYAQVLAKKGMNLLLISRTQTKLEDLAKELKTEHGIEVQVMAVDCTKLPDSKLAEVKKKFDSMQIGLLVNNVGQNFEAPMYYADADASLIADIMTSQLTTVTQFTHMVVPQMVGRKRGVVLNLSSIGGQIPSAMLQPYGACKAFITNFSEALNEEYKSKGVHVQAACPYFVATAMAKRKPSFDCPTPKAYAAASIAKLGTKVNISPYWVHSLLFFALDQIPSCLRDVVIAQIHKMHIDIRRRYNKRQERLAAEGKKK
jgi:17beta-estradiol 17-dehydrogenase / very-long-chain 3-oxoacyl-CoA reductase